MKSAISDDLQPSSSQARLIAALAVAIPLVVLFGPALFSDRSFAMRDAGHYYYPLFKWCADEWGAGRVPLWNSRENCGTSVCADPTASLWYPGKLVFVLPVDFAVRFKLYIALHVVLCAAAAYWLARRWGASVYGSALAAVSYSCGGSVVFQHCNVVYLVGAAWLPLAMGTLDSLLREGRWRSAIWLGMVLSLMILGGDPQMAYHVLLLGGLYAVVLLASRRRESPDRTGIPIWMKLALLAAAALVALLLAAVQILPSAEATAASERARFEQPRNIYEAAGQLGVAGSDWSETRAGLFGPPAHATHHATAYDFSISPWRLAELVWPNCGGRMYPTHRRWFSLLPEEPRIWSPSLYLGLVPLVLGWSTFNLRSGDVRLRWLSWSLLVFTLGSLGTFGLGWILRKIWLATGGGADFPLGDPVGGVYWLFVVGLPNYVYFRYPAKLLVVASLAIAMLASFGWDRALVRPSWRLSLVLLTFGVGSGIAAAAALIASQFVALGQGNYSLAFGPFESRGAWTDIVTSLVHASLVSLAAAWLLKKASGSVVQASGRVEPASGGREPPGAFRPTSLWRSVLLVLCAAELAIANHWLTPTAPANIWRQPSAIAQAIERDAAAPRSYRAPAWWPARFQREVSADRLAEMADWERQILAGRYALLDHAALVNSQSGLKRADHEALLDAVGDSTSGETERAALQRLGVAFLILPGELKPDFAEPIRGDGFPDDVGLWRITGSAFPAGEQVEYRFEPASLYRGAAISVVSWLLLGVFVGWVTRGKLRTRACGSRRPLVGALD